ERTSRFAIGMALDFGSGQNPDWQVQIRLAGRAGMALSDKDRKRAEELARELMKITGGRIKPDGVSKTFAEIEEEAIEVTDIVASALIKQTAKDAPDAPTQCRCPECKAVPGDRGEDDEPIVLLTDRGEVDFLTKGYFCRRCRRSFFPSTR
ncbi:hypothetical protein, partial [Rhodopirellula europaea]